MNQWVGCQDRLRGEGGDETDGQVARGGQVEACFWRGEGEGWVDRCGGGGFGEGVCVVRVEIVVVGLVVGRGRRGGGGWGEEVRGEDVGFEGLAGGGQEEGGAVGGPVEGCEDGGSGGSCW